RSGNARGGRFVFWGAVSRVVLPSAAKPLQHAHWSSRERSTGGQDEILRKYNSQYVVRQKTHVQGDDRSYYHHHGSRRTQPLRCVGRDCTLVLAHIHSHDEPQVV